MADDLTKVYLCHSVLDRTDLQPIVCLLFEGEMALVQHLVRLSEYIDKGYAKWCSENGSDNFSAVFDYEVTPAVADRIVSFMLECKSSPDGFLVTQWTVDSMNEANDH